MAVDVKKVLREKPGSFMSYFLPLLVMAEDNLELIDVLELFGFDRLAEAVARLGGSRITFPTWATLDALVRDAYLVARFDAMNRDYQGRPNLETKTELETEFGIPYSLLALRARTIKDLVNRAGTTPASVPGAKEADQYLKKIKRTNGEIRRAVQQQEDDLG